MRSNLLLGPTVALASAVALWSCGGGGPTSTLTTLMSPTAPSASPTRKASDDSPAPDPTAAPAPDPASDPAPQPTALTISIVGSFGSNAFSPNPIEASLGDMIVWKNSDMTLHHIVLDDGSVVGDVAPGASSVPMALKSSIATYHCTIHPTMVGSINGSLEPPPDPGSGYGGGYDY